MLIGELLVGAAPGLIQLPTQDFPISKPVKIQHRQLLTKSQAGAVKSQKLGHLGLGADRPASNSAMPFEISNPMRLWLINRTPPKAPTTSKSQHTAGIFYGPNRLPLIYLPLISGSDISGPLKDFSMAADTRKCLLPSIKKRYVFK